MGEPYKPKAGNLVKKDSAMKAVKAGKERDADTWKNIAKYTKDKETSIIVSAAIRDAFMWCINHPDWAKEQTDEDRMKWFEKTAKDIVKKVVTLREELIYLYASEKQEQEEAREDKMAKHQGDFVEDLEGEENVIDL